MVELLDYPGRTAHPPIMRPFAQERDRFMREVSGFQP